MNSLIDQLSKEVQELQSAVMAKRYGVGSEQLLLVMGNKSPQEAIESRIGHIPADIRAKVKLNLVHLPWLTHRLVLSGGDALIQTQEKGEVDS